MLADLWTDGDTSLHAAEAAAVEANDRAPLRIGARANLGILAHLQQVQGARAGGLLIGWREGSAARIERPLRCANREAGTAARTRFDIDPQVLVNVGRSLRASPLEILGFYAGDERDPAELPEDDRTLLFRHRGALLLRIGLAGEGSGKAAGWRWNEGAPEPERVALEVAAEQSSGGLRCPE